MIDEAATGRLPPWAEAGEARRAHMARVAALMDAWAVGFGLDAEDRTRWRAAAWLHDALRDADPERLRELLPRELRDLPPPLVHGPAAAACLERDGVDDAALLRAVAYHTIGHPSLDRLGQALYLADFLEPGRTFDPAGRAALRALMPDAMDTVLATVVERRVAYLLAARRRLRLETIQFWNALPAVD